MPSFSRNLEQSLHRALQAANERRHEYATLEHLLLSLIDDLDAAAVMRACSVDLNALRKTLRDYIDTELDNLVTDGRDDAKPTAGFQRVIQRACSWVGRWLKRNSRKLRAFIQAMRRISRETGESARTRRVKYSIDSSSRSIPSAQFCTSARAISRAPESTIPTLEREVPTRRASIDWLRAGRAAIQLRISSR